MMVDVNSSRPGFRPVNASAPCFSRTREGPWQHRVLVRRGGAPRCHFSFSVFRRRLQLWGRPRRQPDRAHAGISAAPTLSAISRARARRRRVVAGRRRSHGDAADRQRDRANGGLCLRRVHSLDFQAGFSGGRRELFIPWRRAAACGGRRRGDFLFRLFSWGGRRWPWRYQLPGSGRDRRPDRAAIRGLRRVLRPLTAATNSSPARTARSASCSCACG